MPFVVVYEEGHLANNVRIGTETFRGWSKMAIQQIKYGTMY